MRWVVNVRLYSLWSIGQLRGEQSLVESRLCGRVRAVENRYGNFPHSERSYNCVNGGGRGVQPGRKDRILVVAISKMCS